MCCVMGYTGHDLSAEKFKEYLLRTVDRGPDDQRVVEGPFGLMGFGRLAIMGLTPEGMQPFYRGADCVVCNGELYGFRFEKEILKRRGYKFCSDCDCEILLPLYYEYGLDMFRHMDAEFALVMYDSRKDRLIAARDPIGIRPLFYGYSKSSHQIAFASEMQNLIGWCDDIRPSPLAATTAMAALSAMRTLPMCPPHAGRHGHRPAEHPRKADRRRRKASGRRCPCGLPALRRSGLLAGVLHCRQEAGQAHPHLCHRHGHRCHRPEIRPPDRRLSGQRAPRDHHQP